MQTISSCLSPVGSIFFCKSDTGLGNALFQIASVYGISKTLGIQCTFPRVQHYIDELNKLNYDHGNTILRNIPVWGKEVAFDTLDENFLNDGIDYNKRYNPKLISLIKESQKNCMIRGHLEDYTYFETVFDDIKALFECDPVTRKKIDQRYGYILNTGNTVAVHFRDYSKVNNRFLDIIPDFYKRTIRYFKEKLVNPIFLIFTDNKNCVDLSLFDSCIYLFIQNEADYIDLYCMSLCKHAIISQSTFSWWACFLNDNPDKVVLYDKKYTYNYLKMFTAI